MIRRRDFLITGSTAIVACGLFAMPARAASDGIVTRKALGPVNAYRGTKGRGALKSDRALGRAALEHSKAMAKSGRMSHDGFKARLRNHRISGAAAENVALGQSDIAAVITAWQKSRGHRLNMLGKYSRMGVAVARDPASGNRPYWTMMLAG